MKFIVSSTVLKRAVAFVLRAIKANPIVPILENIHFTIADKMLTVKGSDLQNTLIMKLPVESSEGATFLLPAVKLNQLLGVLPEQPLTIKVDDKHFGHVVQWDSGKSKLTGENPIDYPKPPKKTGAEVVLTFSGDDRDSFIAGLAGTAYCVSGDELRPAMTGIYLHNTVDALVLAATNGYILSKHPISATEAGSIASCIMPGSYVKTVLNAFNEAEDDITLTLTQSSVEIAIGNRTLIGRLIDEKFPDYQNAIPTNNDKVMAIGKSDLEGAIKRMLITANHTTKQIALKLSGNSLLITSQDLDYSNESDENLLCNYADAPIEIGFSGDNLLKAVSHVPGRIINVSMSEPNRAVLLWGDDDSIITLVMPVMLNTYA